MKHSFTFSGKLISLLMIIGVTAYGLNYQITKTLLHASAVIAFFTWLRLAVSATTQKDGIIKHASIKDPRIVLSTLLVVAATIVLFETSLSDTPMSGRFRKDFLLTAICFALITPVAIVDTQIFKIFRWALPTATLTMAIPGIIDYFTHQTPGYRTSGNISLQIIYGTNLAILSLCTIVLMMTTKLQKHPVLITTCLVASIVGIWAIVLSGSRGPLLSVIIISFTTIALIGLKRFGLIKTALFIILLSITTSLIVIQSPTLIRLSNGIKNISSDVTNSSMGLRLEMWRGAIKIIDEHPLSGVGVGKHNEFFKEKNKESENYIHPGATDFIHLHNDFLNAISWMGIPLGLLFMAFAVYPLYWALRNRYKVAAKAMLGVSAIYLLNGLTNTPSIRATSLTLMLSVIFLLLQFAIYQRESSAQSSNSR